MEESLAISGGSSATPPKEVVEETRAWKFNTIVLYDLVMCHVLEWPALSVEWMPKTTSNTDTLTQRLLVGTHAASDEANALIIMDVKLPAREVPMAGRHYDHRKDYHGFAFGEENGSKFSPACKIPHEGEVNRATHCPQKPSLIATQGNAGNICLFDSNTYGVQSPTRGPAAPYLRLVGHTSEGWGLGWNGFKQGLLASVADDAQLLLWDVNMPTTRRGTLEPFQAVKTGTKPAQALAWQELPGNESNIFTVSDDGLLSLWDLRVCAARKRNGDNSASAVVMASRQPLLSVASNPFRPDVVATAGADPTISVWDLRSLNRPAHQINGHKEAVVELEWSTFTPGLLASAASDRFVTIWDLARVGMEQLPEDGEDGPPELIVKTKAPHRSLLLLHCLSIASS
eukprot:GHVT01048729.1.p1 GENE.GHVT01048729.1~~GHVT01048729.1.p1  ORF type:complete len:400 (-),score=69.33 GHVT01048729.1:555-1754(-)